MSQAALAKLPDLTREYVNKLEAGKQDRSLTMISALLKALSVPVTALLKATSPMMRGIPSPMRSCIPSCTYGDTTWRFGSKAFFISWGVMYHQMDTQPRRALGSRTKPTGRERAQPAMG